MNAPKNKSVLSILSRLLFPALIYAVDHFPP